MKQLSACCVVGLAAVVFLVVTGEANAARRDPGRFVQAEFVLQLDGEPEYPTTAHSGDPDYPIAAHNGDPDIPTGANGGEPEYPDAAHGGEPDNPEAARPAGQTSASQLLGVLARMASTLWAFTR